MNASKELCEEFFTALAATQYADDIDVLICPPALYMQRAQELLKGSKVKLGAQNICAEHADQGAYTGEISAQMLIDFDCEYTLVGHSERRQYYVEDDQCVARKASCAAQHDICPIVCVGETLAEREQELTFDVIKRQLNAVLQTLTRHALVVAYEPIWAIGSGLSATPEQVQAVHAYIRTILTEHYAQYAAKSAQHSAAAVSIIYGGSVKPETAGALLLQDDIDGVLVGGASLSIDDFSAIIESAAAQ